MKKDLITLLLSTLVLSHNQSEPELAAQLDDWADTNLTHLRSQANDLLEPPFSVQELMDLAEDAVDAAQALHNVLAGQERAKVAQALLVWLVKETCPDGIAAWAVPLLSGDGLVQLIEAAFRKVFPDKAPEAQAVWPAQLTTA